MFAIFRKRASKLLAELVALRKKEAALAHRAKEHINGAYKVIDICFEEIDDAQLVIDELEGGGY